MKAVEAIRNDGSEVLGVIAIFPTTSRLLLKCSKAKVKLTSLSNYDTVLGEALAINYISEKDIETLKEWRLSPSDWGKKSL